MKRGISIILVLVMVISMTVLSGCSDKVEVDGMVYYKSELTLIKTFEDTDVHGKTTEIKIYAFPENDHNNGGICLQYNGKKYIFAWDVEDGKYPDIKMQDFDNDGMNEIAATFVYSQNVGEGFKYSELHILENAGDDGYSEQIYTAEEFAVSIEENLNLSEQGEIFSTATKISYGEIVDFEIGDDGKIVGKTKYVNTYKTDGKTIEKTGVISADIEYSSRIFKTSNHTVTPDE